MIGPVDLRARASCRANGFTLIEVLVALVIVAVGVAAVLGALTSAANGTVHLRDKTFAHWVALNRLTEIRLSSAPSADGKSDGVVENYANRRWQWQVDIEPAQLPGLRRIDIQVRVLGSAGDSAPTLKITEEITDKTSWDIHEVGFLGTALLRTIGPAVPTWEPQ